MSVQISASNVWFHYRDEDGASCSPDILKGVSLDIQKGEFVAILGHNGSGKSTFAKHLNGILLPVKGTVTIDGLNPAEEEQLFQVRQKVGMVFQNPDNQIVATIVEEDVAFGPENLGIPPAEIRRRVDEALEAVDMTAYRLHSPSQLSGGQKQRVAIAGIIAMRPDCIVLDEPTAMLDPKGRKEVMDTIQHLKKQYGITIVLITHYMEEAAQADRVVVMNDGTILYDDRPEQVFSHVEYRFLRKSILSIFNAFLVEALQAIGLDVPQVTELTYLLRKAGMDLPAQIIREEDCIQAISAVWNEK